MLYNGPLLSPWDVLPLGRFVPWDVLSLGHFVHGTFCPGLFFPFGRFVLERFVPWDVLFWDVLSVHLMKWCVSIIVGVNLCGLDIYLFTGFLLTV